MPDSPPPPKVDERLVLGALLAAGLALRAWCAHHELWLDEIWSLEQATREGGPWRFFWGPSLDNNHPLNSLWMWLVGDVAWWPLHRLPAVATGTGLVWLAWLWGARAGGASLLAKALPAALVAVSPLMVTYGSEARGHGPMLFLGLAAALCVEPAVRGRRGAIAAFPALGLGALLFHLGSATLLAAAAAWAAWLAATAREDRKACWARVAMMIAPLALGAAVYWWGRVRAMRIGGGPEYGLAQVLGDAACSLAGLPSPFDIAVSWPALVVLAAVVAGGLAVVWRADRGRAVFLGAGIVAAPALQLAVMPDGILYVRYFLPSLLLVLLLAGEVAARAATMPRRAARVAALALVGLLLATTLARTVAFATTGRGQAIAMVQAIAEATPGPAVTVSHDHPLRMRLLLGQAARWLPAGKSIVQYPVAQESRRWPSPPPQWVLMHRGEGEAPPDRAYTLAGGRYELWREWPAMGPSGFRFYAFARASPATPPPSGARREDGV